MQDKHIKVTIPQFGAPSVEAVGFDGVGCQEATAAIEAALNSSGDAQVEHKPEWNNSASEETEEQNLTW